MDMLYLQSKYVVSFYSTKLMLDGNNSNINRKVPFFYSQRYVAEINFSLMKYFSNTLKFQLFTINFFTNGNQIK